MAFRVRSQTLWRVLQSSSGAGATARAFHTSRPLNGAGGPAWGTQVNEPGGRLFGEKILKPGERRKLYSWEVPYYTTMALGFVILTIGLNSRPESKLHMEVEREAAARVAALGLDDDDE